MVSPFSNSVPATTQKPSRYWQTHHIGSLPSCGTRWTVSSAATSRSPRRVLFPRPIDRARPKLSLRHALRQQLLSGPKLMLSFNSDTIVSAYHQPCCRLYARDGLDQNASESCCVNAASTPGASTLNTFAAGLVRRDLASINAHFRPASDLCFHDRIRCAASQLRRDDNRCNLQLHELS